MVCNDDRTLCALTTSVCSATSSRCGRSVDRDTNARAQRDGAVAQRKDCTFVSACARSLRALLRSRPSSACAIVLKGMRGAAQRQRSPKTFLHTGSATTRCHLDVHTATTHSINSLSHTHPLTHVLVLAVFLPLLRFHTARSRALCSQQRTESLSTYHNAR